ncbi:MAG TPA: hypothetical protein VFV25_02205, partial [Methylibium sp.]
MSHRTALAAGLAALSFTAAAIAADQTAPGAGNPYADRIAAASPRVREAHVFLVEQAMKIRNAALRAATLDLLRNRGFCITSRAGVNDAVKSRM